MGISNNMGASRILTCSSKSQHPVQHKCDIEYFFWLSIILFFTWLF